MTAYPTPMVKKITYHGHNESLDGNPVEPNTICGECSSSSFASSAVTCDIRVINITNIKEGFYKIVFNNSVGEIPFTVFVNGNYIYLRN